MAHYLVGTHGVGKSSLLPFLMQMGFYTTDGISRPVKYFIRDTKALGPEEEQRLINELTLFNYKNQLEHKKCISTRSIIDCIAYSNILFPDIDTSNLENILFETRDKIEHLFYIPIEFELKKDGVRMQDKRVQKQIDNKLKYLLYSSTLVDPMKITTVTGTVEERIEIIKNIIQ